MALAIFSFSANRTLTFLRAPVLPEIFRKFGCGDAKIGKKKRKREKKEALLRHKERNTVNGGDFSGGTLIFVPPRLGGKIAVDKRRVYQSLMEKINSVTIYMALFSAKLSGEIIMLGKRGELSEQLTGLLRQFFSRLILSEDLSIIRLGER